MSYILDALKKSDQERKRREPPGLQTVHQSYSAPPEQKKTGPLLKWLSLVTVLLLLTVSGIVWLKKDNPPENISKKNREEIPVQQTNIQPAVDVRNKPNRHVEEEQLPTPQPETMSPARIHEQRISDISNEGPDEKAFPDVQEEDRTTPSPALSPATPKNASTSNLQNTTASSPDQEPSENTTVSTTPNVAPNTQAADKQRAETAPPIEIDKEIVYLWELPVAVQKDIPEIKMEGHVYAEEPSLRMIIINNKIVREGDQVQGSLFLEEITWEGVILRYDTTLFRLDMF